MTDDPELDEALRDLLSFIDLTNVPAETQTLFCELAGAAMRNAEYFAKHAKQDGHPDMTLNGNACDLLNMVFTAGVLKRAKIDADELNVGVDNAVIISRLSTESLRKLDIPEGWHQLMHFVFEIGRAQGRHEMTPMESFDDLSVDDL